MPNKESGGRQGRKSVRRVTHRTTAAVVVSGGGNKKESGPPRLYAPSDSLRSTSTQESGSRRLYMSRTAPGPHSILRRTMKPAQ